MVIVRNAAMRSYLERYRTRVNRRELATELNEYFDRMHRAGRTLDSPLTLKYDHQISMLLQKHGEIWFVTDVWRDGLAKGGCV